MVFVTAGSRNYIANFGSAPFLCNVSDVTSIVSSAPGDNAHASEEVLPLVYEELRKLAAARMSNEWDTSTLQPTALVHEAWLRLTGSAKRPWDSRGHFFAAAAEAMRRILIDHARRKHALKRGVKCERIDLDQLDVAVQTDAESLLLVDEALQRLSERDSKAGELVKLRFFAGLSYSEAAEALGISERSAKRCWTFARAWLYRELTKSAAN